MGLELSFAINFYAQAIGSKCRPAADVQIVKFTNGALFLTPNGELKVAKVNGEDGKLLPGLCVEDNNDFDQFKLITIETKSDYTKISMITSEESDNAVILDYQLLYDSDDSTITVPFGGQNFIGLIAKPRLQTANQSFDLINGQDRWYCGKAKESESSCSNYEYNVEYYDE